MKKLVWAAARDVTDVGDCYFYHTMDIPSYGVVQGEWDLRGREASYLGHVDFQGKRVLELGTASGHLCFAMEKFGADVVAYDLSDEEDWDIVPYADYDYLQHISERRRHIRRLNNGFWLAHKAFGSRARVMYGTVYEIPDDIGEFDVCTFGSILLHLRDPFLALQRASSHVRETVIVTDVLSPRGVLLSAAELLTGKGVARFLPRAKRLEPTEAWWHLTPRVVAEFLHVLGFTETRITFHRQLNRNKMQWLYTVVGERAASFGY